MNLLKCLNEEIEGTSNIVEPTEVDSYVNDDGIEVYLNADGDETPVEDEDYDDLPKDVDITDFLLTTEKPIINNGDGKPQYEPGIPPEAINPGANLNVPIPEGKEVTKRMVCPQGYKLIDNKCVKI